MASLKSINSRVTVAGALTLQDLAEAAEAGFRTVLNFRPDGESANQVASDDARQAAERLGLSYVFIPTTKHELFTDAVVEPAQAAFRDADGPILAYCAGGQRAAIVWAATEARNQRPIADVLSELKLGGFDFAFLRDDLDAQADRLRWTKPSADDAAPGATAPIIGTTDLPPPREAGEAAAPRRARRKVAA